MNHAQLGALLHLVDQTLPIGGYTQSNGLETFVQQRVVHDAASLRAYVREQLMQNWRHNDGAYVSLAYDAAAAGDLAALLEHDVHLGARKAPREVREGSYKLGVRLFKIFTRHYQHPLLDDFQKALNDGLVKAYYPIVFALFACVMQIAKADALYAFYYNSAVAVVTNGVKLIPLSQMDGQDIVFELRDLMTQATQMSLTPDMDSLGACMMASDIRAMQHERLYTRLYMS